MHNEASRTIEDFQSVARQYCTLVENSTTLSRDAFLKQIHVLLPLLVAYAARLPNVSPDSENLNDEKVEQGPIIEAINRTLGEQHSNHFYELIFDPWEKGDNPPVASSLAIDLAEIYADIKEGFAALERGGPLNDVLWEWKYGFESHWGRHATQSLVAVHSLLVDW